MAARTPSTDSYGRDRCASHTDQRSTMHWRISLEPRPDRFLRIHRAICSYRAGLLLTFKSQKRTLQHRSASLALAASEEGALQLICLLVVTKGSTDPRRTDGFPWAQRAIALTRFHPSATLRPTCSYPRDVQVKQEKGSGSARCWNLWWQWSIGFATARDLLGLLRTSRHYMQVGHRGHSYSDDAATLTSSPYARSSQHTHTVGMLEY
jgi:hypothetical protein